MKQIFYSYQEKQAHKEREEIKKSIELLCTEDIGERMNLYFSVVGGLEKQIKSYTQY